VRRRVEVVVRRGGMSWGVLEERFVGGGGGWMGWWWKVLF
jgi:hypothetical protein